MIYQEYEINTILQPYVKVIWSMENDASVFDGPPIHILPDSCVELVVHFGDPFKTTFSNNSTSVQTQSFVVAQMRNFMKIQSNGKTGIIAARFSALGAYHFFGLPMKEITNREIGLGHLWIDFAAEIEEKVHLAKTTQHRSEIIQHYLQIQLLKNGSIDNGIEFCVNEIKRTKGLVSVEALASKVGISNRHLARRFDKCIGLSPKEFSRIIKFIGSLDTMQHSSYKSLTDVALEAGYYDQSHFIHDFKEFSGMTPGEYLISTNVVY